ncbi:hypothetical protein J2X43_005291 [Rhizobium sp. BE258]|nr:hypothetical protein [Rhizobium sp. BE258]
MTSQSAGRSNATSPRQTSSASTVSENRYEAHSQIV